MIPMVSPDLNSRLTFFKTEFLFVICIAEVHVFKRYGTVLHIVDGIGVVLYVGLLVQDFAYTF